MQQAAVKNPLVGNLSTFIPHASTNSSWSKFISLFFNKSLKQVINEIDQQSKQFMLSLDDLENENTSVDVKPFIKEECE